MYAEPSWMRLGFSAPPDNNSGQGVGIIIIDNISPHPALCHFGKRLKHVVVADDFSITCNDIANENFDPSKLDYGTHGLMTVIALAHAPFISHELYHKGIASAGNFIVLSHGAFRDGEGERLKRGVDWILGNIPEFNIRIILSLGWHAQDNTVLLEQTMYNSTVQGLAAAVEQGILVVCANGNSDIEIILPPIEFMAVGGFNDRGVSDPAHRTQVSLLDTNQTENASLANKDQFAATAPFQYPILIKINHKWGGIWLSFNDTFRFGAHAVILNSEGHVLLLKRTYGDKGWSFPGGSVEPGETIHQALHRECLEELGVGINDVVLTGFYYHSKYNSQAAIFRCSIQEKYITLNYEHSEYRWMHLSELSEVHRIRVLDARRIHEPIFYH